ncbi:hypothetical protein SK128_015345 [Halocaridina rubra]|uniref:Uncharacterized protein n=1 Tax=Halocaridina rubra TaxID=373956 RepID=A0AAN9AFN2_HALRR
MLKKGCTAKLAVPIRETTAVVITRLAFFKTSKYVSPSNVTQTNALTTYPNRNIAEVCVQPELEQAFVSISTTKLILQLQIFTAVMHTSGQPVSSIF